MFAGSADCVLLAETDVTFAAIAVASAGLLVRPFAAATLVDGIGVGSGVAPRLATADAGTADPYPEPVFVAVLTMDTAERRTFNWSARA